jgi:hypothetical protein
MLAEKIKQLSRERDKPPVRLIVLDPISSYLGDSDQHKMSDVRTALQNLVDLAERCHMAVIAVTHENKAEKMSSALYRISGSVGFSAVPRCVWFVVKDKKDSKRRLFVCPKMNIAPEPPGLAFKTKDNRVLWEKESVVTTIDEAITETGEKKDSIIDAAADWLEKLFVSGRSVLAMDVFEEGQAQGFSKKQLQMARTRLSDRIGTMREGFGPGSKMRWYAKDEAKAGQ